MFLQGVASMECGQQGMSPMSFDESLSGCGSMIPVFQAVISPVVPVVEASFNSCPVLPVNGLLEDKTKVHVAGVPLSSVNSRL